MDIADSPEKGLLRAKWIMGVYRGIKEKAREKNKEWLELDSRFEDVTMEIGDLEEELYREMGEDTEEKAVKDTADEEEWESVEEVAEESE